MLDGDAGKPVREFVSDGVGGRNAVLLSFETTERFVGRHPELSGILDGVLA